ncbi:NAD(P)-dependent oxidoreductase [Ramlibacter henchirensis]|uniref:NAD(P)-dependent oxidoreductase n=1 Tax=Ramlibacter henchirensis TaxID=204072 RepID=A0A4Z0C1A4_9BURK|nr:NAD(P)-dependent oxidoreductase [Ramlibacter henchirensis]TFZ05303.1 NAD(P)-dependent oxidoreductase [Ramlibacter henchirensis]
MSPGAGSVGIVGVGNMGGGMAARLLEQGWPVRACDLVPEKVEALRRLGATSAASSADAATGARALIVCVVDALECEQVLFGDRGAAGALARGTPVLLCPTIAPEDAESLAARLAAAGALPIDAPMSGGPARAREGSMSLMVACSDEAFDAAAPLLAVLSGKVFRVGTRAGDGAKTKLVNNLLAGINLVGAAEALALAQRLGLDLSRTLGIIEQSSGQSWIGSDRMRRAIAGDYEPRAHVTLLRKDTALAIEAARRAGFDGPLGATARDVFDQAAKAGLADLDDAAIFRWLSRP